MAGTAKLLQFRGKATSSNLVNHSACSLRITASEIITLPSDSCKLVSLNLDSGPSMGHKSISGGAPQLFGITEVNENVSYVTRKIYVRIVMSILLEDFALALIRSKRESKKESFRCDVIMTSEQ